MVLISPVLQLKTWPGFEMALLATGKLPTLRSGFASISTTQLSRRSLSTPVNDLFSIQASPIDAGDGRALTEAVNAKAPRNDWTRDEIRDIYNTPLMELAFQAVRTCALHNALEELRLKRTWRARALYIASSTVREQYRCARL